MRWNWLEAQPGDHRTARKRRRMSKQERRQQRLKAEDERQRLEKSRTPRHPHDLLSFPGAGTLIVQLLIWEPWRECESWDIRLLPDSTIAAFYSKSESDSSWLLTGFERVPIDSSELQRVSPHLAELAHWWHTKRRAETARRDRSFEGLRVADAHFGGAARGEGRTSTVLPWPSCGEAEPPGVR